MAMQPEGSGENGPEHDGLMRLLDEVLATEIVCVVEVIRFLASADPATRRLMEQILAREGGRTEEERDQPAHLQ